MAWKKTIEGLFCPSMRGAMCTVKTMQTFICLRLVAPKQDEKTMAKCLCCRMTKADSCLFAFKRDHTQWSLLKGQNHVVIKPKESRWYCSIPLSHKGLLRALLLRISAQNHFFSGLGLPPGTALKLKETTEPSGKCFLINQEWQKRDKHSQPHGQHRGGAARFR